MIRFWEIERREEINITHKSLLRWNAVTSFYCFPLLLSYRQTRRNGDFQKHQYLDYQKINPLDVVKHNVWVPRSIHSYHKIVSNLIIKWLTYLTPYFRASNFLYDFSRSSSITKFAETGIHKHQYFDYQMTTHTSRNAMHGYVKHLLFPRKQSTRWLSVS